MKTDRELGKRVQEYLIANGVETPILESKLNESEKIDLIKDNMETVIDVLGLDRQDDSIGGTADRVAKMYVSELCFGLSYNRFPKITTFDNKMKYDQMVIQKDITFHSLCEHHFVNFNGMAQVAYIPKDKVIGLSKLNRVVNFFARRPQVQERLNEQIYYALQYVLGTDDIAVLMDAEHLCVKSRGIGDQQSGMTTSKLGGAFFEDGRLRNEFMQLAVRR
jgi:GTP cyclohydrolase IA|tara:strand:+ start:1334 stop:1993 length:660 start_codon:yes stop_codon:yes gene_type:complete